MLTVTQSSGLVDEYATGAKWHIDEDELLHILDANKVGLGSYANGCWASVRTLETSGPFGVSATTYSGNRTTS